jgi:catechol 2,3-dioxygenase-like lactoylglutathione lyase family enzyme
MPRGLDHIVHAVRDLDRAGALYERLGFAVGARNRHPWGTHNRIVQFPGVFIELLTFAEQDKLGADGFSVLFAAYNRDFAAAHEGLSMLILESRGAVEDVKAFEKAGIAASPVMRFERGGQRPDGTPVKVGFSLAFADAGSGADLRFATCQQHYPENFWNPAFQQHPNGVTGIAAVSMVAADPAAHRSALLAFTGASETRGHAHGYDVPLPRGSISVGTPAAFTSACGVAAPDPGSGLRLAAIHFPVRDLPRLRHLLAASNVASSTAGEAIVVPPAEALGATLVFTPAG